MTTKHTPGPWHYELHLPRGSADGYFRITASSGWVIADLPDDGTDNDARLIAAAPDMLAALKDLLPMWESGIDEPWVKAARAAITKAEGES